jgi:two-component system, cell cycle sensor histidine kinase and response regulator CckA
MDIDGRELAEERLRLQAAALEAAANSIVITDRKEEILWTNPAFSELTGYAAEKSRPSGSAARCHHRRHVI